MKQSRNQLKQWFKKFAYPTESQFWDWIDSFFHKDDKIPAGQIDGLQEVVSGIQEGINDRIEEIAKVATNNHEELNNRDLPDQHPISAITELEEALIQIQQKFIPLTGNNGNDSPITGDLFFKGNRGLNSLGDLYLTCGSGRTISLKALLNGNIQIAASGNGNIDLIASGNSKAYYNGQELATKNLLTPISQQLSTAQTAIDEHTGEISHIRKTVTALQGVGGYLTAYDFGTSTPTQQQLTDYALSQIPNITADEIFNGTRVTNLNTGDLWILVTQYRPGSFCLGKQRPFFCCDSNNRYSRDS